jgi:hypothetical protein
MRHHMLKQPTPSSRLILLYKMWHSPVFLVGNALQPAFLSLASLVGLCTVSLVLLVAVGWLAGGVVGTTGAVIGAVIGLFASVFVWEKVMDLGLIDGEYLRCLREDIFSGSGELHTINGSHVFPFLCAVQSIAILGLAGAVAGPFFRAGEINSVPLAVVSAFLAFFCAQLLSYCKKGVKKKVHSRVLSMLQAIVLGLLLLPAKNLLADQDALASVFDQVAGVLGGDIGVNAAFVAGIGWVTERFCHFFSRDGS